LFSGVSNAVPSNSSVLWALWFSISEAKKSSWSYTFDWSSTFCFSSLSSDSECLFKAALTSNNWFYRKVTSLSSSFIFWI
jgi:hypothetical protein